MQPVEPETAYILFADVVAFSLLALEAQAEVTSRFRDVARRVSSAHACDLLLDSGDGAALIFFGRVRAAVECTLQLGEELRSSSIEARLGLHCGTVSRIRDINDRPNAIGPGLNLAERVMSSGDAGHILLSGAAAEIVSQETALGGSLLDFGEHEVKHGVRVRLFSLVTDQCGRGDLPEKLRTSGATKRKNNFTSPERQFVGRRTELESLKQRLESGQERLITITGPGGIGKSRLALQAAVDGADNYADGAWIVECDTLRNSEDLLLQIAHVLEVPIGGSPLSSVLSALSQRQILLVLDCFERLVPHAAAVEELLKHSRELQIVATSRTLLGLPRESEFVLGPFPTDHGSGGADAVALFASAARQASPDFAVGRQNRETVEAIIEFVEGIPLAIILAAGRLRHLSLAELRTQLSEHRLDILRRRSPGEDRHSDLRRVVDDSFTLLTERLKDLLVYLSVFKGFALGDATEVVSNVPNVLDGISELRENSLLTAVVTADQMRYRTLDVVAEYLESAAKSYELDPVRRRHALYFTHKAVGVRELYEDGRWREGSAAVTADLGNFRRAIEYAVGSKEPELVRPLARSLCRILMESGFLSDFEVLSEAAQRIAEVEHDLETLVEITGLRGACSDELEGSRKPRRHGWKGRVIAPPWVTLRKRRIPGSISPTWPRCMVMLQEPKPLSKATPS
jgi:predicted ATPase/class 3 adenylate cyclase